MVDIVTLSLYNNLIVIVLVVVDALVQSVPRANTLLLLYNNLADGLTFFNGAGETFQSLRPLLEEALNNMDLSHSEKLS